jgi:hypothetical protein
MNRARLAMLFVAMGIFLPLFAVPFADGYRRNAGLVANIQSMSLRLTSEKYSPQFTETFTDAEVGLTSTPAQDKNSIERKAKPDIFDAIAPDYQSVSYGNSGKNVRFDKSVSQDEINKILRTGKNQIEHSKSNNLAFTGWALSRPALRLPFPFLVSGALLVAFTGIVLRIFARNRS